MSSPRPRRRAAPASPGAPVELALQGGGSHGAFTWGVLDRLLQDATLDIHAVSGTSAGALNAAVLATGWARGGREGARQALGAFWHEIGGASGCFGHSLVHPAWGPGAVAGGTDAPPGPATTAAWAPWPMPGLDAFNLDRNPFYAWFNGLLRLLSPYQFNPLGLDPLREVVRRHVDVRLLADSPLAVYVTATAVRTGQPRVFDNRQRGGLTVDALLASACLPQLFRAVTIDGEPFWDGGYSGNPSLWPLVYGTDVLDLLLVRTSPLQRPATPDTPEAIADRVNEITFNAGLLGELRAIAFVQKLVEEGRIDAGEYKNLRLHAVADDAGLARLSPSSKLNTSLAFLQQLHALGRAAAERWLLQHRADVGMRSSLDIRRDMLGQA